VKLRQEIKTLTAQGRLSGLIIGVLPIGLAVFLLAVNPEYIPYLVHASNRQANDWRRIGC